MSASATTGIDPAWPSSRRGHRVAMELFETVADQPLVSVHNGLPARYLAEDLPITDPINLLISHDQGMQALLRSSGIKPEFSLTNGWRAERRVTAGLCVVWRHLAAAWAQPWMQADGDAIAALAHFPSFREDRDPKAVYDALVDQLAEQPMYPRRMLADREPGPVRHQRRPCRHAARPPTAELTTRTFSGRVVPTFSPDRYLDPARRRWRTDADLLAEVTGVGTEDLDGFVEALQERRQLSSQRWRTRHRAPQQ